MLSLSSLNDILIMCNHTFEGGTADLMYSNIAITPNQTSIFKHCEFKNEVGPSEKSTETREI